MSTTRKIPDGAEVVVIGGGAAGAMVIREFQNSSHSENQVVCVIDDNPSKRGALLMGVPIVGDREKIESTVQKYGIEEIVLAIPSAQLKDRTELISICQRTGCRLKTLPALYQLANGEVSVKKVRDVDIVDLLGRATVDVAASCAARSQSTASAVWSSSIYTRITPTTSSRN